MKNFNLYFLEYAINSLLRDRAKNIAIVTIFTFLIFVVSSMLFIASSIKHELSTTVDALPDITIQKLHAGRVVEIDEERVDEIVQIAGVSDALTRVWGYYYFENVGANFTIVGIDSFENQYKESLSKIASKYDSDELANTMIVGRGVKEVLSKSYYREYFNFILPSGKLKKMQIVGTFESDLELESNDMIVLSKQSAREIFGLEESKATDIIVKVANPTEIPTITAKIKEIIPNSRIITQEDLHISYANIFNYQSGIFLSLFIVALLSFFMIIYDKASGLSSAQRHEIGVLKALGWRIDDILKERFYEAAIVSMLSYILGVMFALGFVYAANAPIFANLFMGYSNLKSSFELPFILDFATLTLIFLVTIPIYIGATIIPSWQVATMESDEVMR
jgi:ABC-type lipoprotein release transport system permease subunit